MQGLYEERIIFLNPRADSSNATVLEKGHLLKSRSRILSESLELMEFSFQGACHRQETKTKLART